MEDSEKEFKEEITMALGAMQPYLFPYLGYFQLMNCVQTYVFCGNLQYIKRGYVNRNRLITDLKKNKIDYFTFSVSKDDYRKNINQRYYSNLKGDSDKLRNSLFRNYKKAPNFEEAYYVIDEALQFQNENVAYFNMHANYTIASYLGIKTYITCTDIIKDKAFWEEFCQLEREARVVFLCQYFNENSYVNAIGGTALYHKQFFIDHNIELSFIKMDDVFYGQQGSVCFPNLSIIDVIMHNKIDEVKILLNKYQII